MSDLKKAWKKTAKSLILAANDLGGAVVDSVKVGAEKAVTWAKTEDEPVEAAGADIPAENSEESPKTDE